MTDETKVDRAVVALVDDKGNPVGRAAKARSPIAPKIRQPGNALHDYVTREELILGCSNAAMAVGQKMYDQFTAETSQFLDDMEKELANRIDQAIYYHSWRGRRDRLLAWLRAKLEGWGLMQPPASPDLAIVDAVDVLDPNVAAGGGPEREEAK